MKRPITILLLVFYAISFSYSHALEDGRLRSDISSKEDAPAYRISKGDVLKITVYEEPDLTKKLRVSGDGLIKFPLLGDVKIEGLTIEEVADVIEWYLEKDYLVDAEVTVFIEEYAKFNVLGEVKKPGTFELKGALTVVDAIALAGGFTDIAHPNGVRVVREEKGKSRVIKVPIGSILKSGDKRHDVLLKEGDTIVVPESFF